MNQRAGWMALALAATLVGVNADTITLADGRSYEGNVTDKNGTYTVQAGDAWYQFKAFQIQSVNGEVVTPVIRIATEKGDMLVALFEDRAPNTVANIITLAESDFYDGVTFHRIIPGFMAQGGCPNSKDGAEGQPGTGGPGYAIADETVAELTHSERGIVSMANSGPDTNGSQFFILFGPAPHLDGKHTVFGKVVKGMNVLEKLEDIGAPTGEPAERVHFDVEVVAKRDHEYTVKKLEEEKEEEKKEE